MEEPVWMRGRIPRGFWKSSENRCQYMQWLGETLGFKTPKDWYRITLEDFCNNKARGLIAYFGDSPSAAVKEYIPDYDWKEWLFQATPQGFWKSPENRRRYMQWLGEKLDYKKPEDWYRVTAKDFYKNKGSRFLYHCQDSLAIAVMEYIPDYNWKEWLFKTTPQGFWSKLSNRRRYMQWLGEKLGFRNPEDWYKITAKDFHKNKGKGILGAYYQNSPATIVKEYLPNHEWKEWLFDMSPRNFWENPDNRRRYMQWLGEKLGFKIPEDWYRIKQKDFLSNKGSGLLQIYYRKSPSVAVLEYMPNYDWKEWLFDMSPLDFWKGSDNRRRYMQWLGKRLGFRNPEDWYRITRKDFLSNKGGGLLQRYYQNSPSAVVMDYFSEYEWKEWLFNQVPSNFWGNPDNRHRYMQWLGEKLGFKNPEAWYRITVKDFQSNKGGGLLASYYQSSPSVAVMAYLPEYNWQSEKFAFRKKRQQQLYRIIKRVFSEYDVEWEFTRSDMRFGKTRKLMKFDTFVPSLNLAFEYQGEQHFFPVETWGGVLALKETQRRDKEKRKACKKYGITLIEVDYSWDGREDTAIEMLTHQFVKKVKDRVEGTKQIQAALKAINTYCKKKQRKQRKRNSTDSQGNFSFLTQQQNG